MVWCGGEVVFLTDNNTTPTKVVLVFGWVVAICGELENGKLILG